MDTDRLVEREQLLQQREEWRKAGRKLVFTNGCFDLVHLGHVRYLEEARALGDILVVGLNSDASVKRLKGPNRPLVPEQARAAVMTALRPVDYVIIFEEDTAEAIVAVLQPDLYVKGGDYNASEAVSSAGKPLPEAAIVRQYGGQVRLIPFLPDHSTTALIQKIVALYAPKIG